MSAKMIIADLNLLYSPLCFSTSWHWLCLNNHNRGGGGTALMKQMRGLIPLWVTYFINTRFLVIAGSSSFLCCHHCLDAKKIWALWKPKLQVLGWTPAAAGANAETKIQSWKNSVWKLIRLQDWSKTGSNPVKQSFCCSQRLDMQLSFSKVDADCSKGLSLSLHPPEPQSLPLNSTSYSTSLAR